ncbi:MAG TPA: EAL domain-containing protein [Dehalococcoidia bacterium]|nr:EAL domain-containing protein [Dehalococcoidia bacterium]
MNTNPSTDSYDIMMCWSRRLLAAFWAVFCWFLLTTGPLPDRLGIAAAVSARWSATCIFVASAVVTAVSALVLRHVARYIERQVQALAFNDALTGLPNRALLHRRLEQAVVSPDKLPVAVLFIDLDRFKLINDRLGHVVGDQALALAARCLEACIRPGDTLARFGGDEFVLLRERISGSSEVVALAEELIESLARPLRTSGGEVSISASVGIVLSHAELDDASRLLRDADRALYEAKAEGRSTFAVFNPNMSVGLVDQTELGADLRHATGRGELKLFYQPQFSVQTGELMGFEALLRWNHPSRGLLLPSHFIQVAEENGSLIEIGLWALESACFKLRRWRLSNPGRQDIKMSVNLSVRQLEQQSLVSRVKGILDGVGVEPSALCLEVTESVLVRDREKAASTLTALRALGVMIALDDFGTGYSSLSYLGQLPIDAIKIDKSFINGLERDASNLLIVQGIVTLAHDLGMGVIAEGVETEAQLMLLRGLDCDWAQGFHLSRPISSEVLDALASGNGTQRLQPVQAAA